MSIIGKWKVAFAASFSENGIVWLKPDEYRKAHSNSPKETEQLVGAILEFVEDGSLLYCVPLPAEASQEQIDEAVKVGAIRVKDGYAYNVMKWKEEDGKYLCDSEIKGEVLGEEVSSWIELIIDDSGILNFMNMLRLEKI